jgi:succinyl-CoA synthetase alpha subunit
MNDQKLKCIVMIGEIGGQLEADAAHWIKAMVTVNQLCRFHCRCYCSSRKNNGARKCIMDGSDDTAEAKKQIMRECGITLWIQAEIGKKVKEVIG